MRFLAPHTSPPPDATSRSIQVRPVASSTPLGLSRRIQGGQRSKPPQWQASHACPLYPIALRVVRLSANRVQRVRMA